MPTWYFETGNPPFYDNQSPPDGYSNVDKFTLVSIDVADAESYVDLSTLDAYVNGADAYRIGVGFVSPYDGYLSGITSTILDGYDGYTITFDRTGYYPPLSDITFRIVVDDYGGNTLDESWTFQIEASLDPFIDNEDPARNATGVSQSALISFDVLDPEGEMGSDTLNVYVEGNLAYGGGVFISPYDGASSYVSAISAPGGDGYHVVVDKTSALDAIVPVRATATDPTGGSVDDSWGFTTLFQDINVIYYSDGYGIKKIYISNIAGESQSQAVTILDYPVIPSNDVSSLFGNFISNNSYLVACYDDYGGVVDAYGMADDAYGVSVIRNEAGVTQYLDGYTTNDGSITDKGILYVVNRNLNRVEVYYGAHFRDDNDREPDFIYNATSSPALFPGEILCLHVEDAQSVRLSGGARLFVGTSLGMTRVDTYDQQTVDGYSDGYDGYGLATTFGIIGSGAQFESIGGTIPRVTAASTDELSTIFVVTNDGLGDGGLTQIAMSGYRRLAFLTQATGFIPSNDIRDVFGKTFTS